MEQSKFYQIKNITEQEYTLVGCDGSVITRPIQDIDKSASAFTIQDAKDGDVLISKYGNIGVFQKNDDFTWTSYFSLGYNGGFQDFKVEHENEKTYPATKEQRDTLMKAMTDAGYTLDFEKKELKKIEQESAEWSKEDKKMLNQIISIIENTDGNLVRPENISIYTNWLKSKVQPQPKWKPSDLQIEALESATANCAYSEYEDCLKELIEQLKQL